MKSLGKINIKKNNLIGLFLMLTFYHADVCSAQSPTIIPRYNMKQYDEEFQSILRNSVLPTHDLSKRLTKVSGSFIGKKYILGALGEGVDATYDKCPLYRTDAFDCVTYVSTVLALIKSQTQGEFVSNLKKIQYENGQVSYFNRHHFMEVDWDQANKNNNFVVDVTAQISSHYKIAYAFVDKPSWYKHLSSAAIKVFSFSSSAQDQRLLSQLHQHANKVHPCVARTSYIPLTELFMFEAGNLIPNEILFNRIPSGSIVELVDKTHNFKEQIGTDLNIAHLGFAIRTNHGLLFRHASKVWKEVVEVPLVQYLKRYYELSANPDQLGIHVLKII